MKEEFDLSRYLNHSEKSDGSQILSELISKAVSTKQETEQAEPMKQSETSQQSSASEQKLHTESLNEAVKAEHSEQEKRQAVSSIPRRISHKQRQESLESYREAFLLDRRTDRLYHRAFRGGKALEGCVGYAFRRVARVCKGGLPASEGF